MEDNVVAWNQELLIPIQLPTTKDMLDFQLYDSDTVKDELVANLQISIKEVIKKVGGDSKKRKYHM